MGRYNDYELLYLVRNNDESALEKLIENYKPIIYKVYYQLRRRLDSFQFDDGYQAGLVGLYTAVSYYKEDRNMAFSTFAIMCITREMYATYRKERKNNYAHNSRILSLDMKLNESEEIYLSDINLIDQNNDPASIAMSSCLLDEVYEILDSVEVKVLELKTKGYSYKEMANHLGVTAKTIDNYIQKIRKKLHSLFD
ncbi:MAG: sigma-70 family RNA polymerase sigma factor [Bacillota bacterium]|jgi:RNA polymerase sporulation-specific sigma factor|nr:sigma-70 family RNA polymerase sigma factor [Bacillota bacterium]NLL26060.1 sigma-70 family RNA polymerase sigma factor [Erysipelotrichia bacterium]